VIDFRYHLVSIVAVFLALAIGIVLGSTELQGHTIDVLRATSDSQASRLNAAIAQREALSQQVTVNDQFLQTAEPKLVSQLLTGQSLVIVTEPGASAAVVTGVKQAAVLAGATVTGQVSLQPKFNDLSGATQSSLSTINQDIATTDGTPLAEGTDPLTAYQQQAAQLIASAILIKKPGQFILPIATAQTLLDAYNQAGYLTVSGAPVAGATLAVVVTPQSAPADGPNDPANEVLLAVAQQFAAASAATLVAGSAAGSAQAGSAISVLRSSSVSGQVSSVDNADATLGQISTIWALAQQLAGGKPNSYGISGASGVSPSVLPTPTVSPTVTAHPKPTGTAHPKPTGTGRAKKKT
jgi:hypothetical protein